MTNIMFLMRVAVVFFLGGMAARDVDAFDQNAANNNVGDEQALEIPALERLDSCDPIPHDLSIAVQSFQVVGDIICHKPRLITVRPGQAIEFHADSNIVMRNLNFFIHPTASLTFVTEGAISIGKDQALNKMPLLSVAGDLTLKAKGWLPGDEEMNDNDLSEVMNVYPGGRVHINQTPKYTKNSVLISASHEEDQEEESNKMDGEIDKPLQHAPRTKTTERLADPDDSVTLEPLRKPQPQPRASPAASTVQPVIDVNSGSPARHSNAIADVHTNVQANVHADASANAAHRVYKTTAPTSYALDSADNTTGNSSVGTDDEPAKNARGTQSSAAGNYSDGVAGDSREESRSAANESDGEKSDSDGSDGEQSDSSGQKTETEIENMTVLKVGDILRIGQHLTSDDGNAAVWTEKYSNIRFGRSPETILGNHGKNFGDVPPKTLIRPDLWEVGAAVRRRNVLWKVARAKEVAAKAEGVKNEGMDGVNPKKNEEEKKNKKKKRGILGWLEKRRAKRAERKRAKEERDAALVGQVDMTIDRRGRVEVIMGGRKVLSRSGPRSIDFFNRFPFAKRRADSEKYEVYVTKEGIEIRLEGRLVWKIRADDIPHNPNEYY